MSKDLPRGRSARRPSPKACPGRGAAASRGRREPHSVQPNDVQTEEAPTARQSQSVDHLSTYFRDLGAHDLLNPEQERELAHDLEETELRTWGTMLSYPPAVEFLLTTLEARLDNSLTEFRNLRRAALTARKSRSKSARAKLRAVAKRTAIQLRALDHDRQHVAALIAELERLRSFGGAPPPHLRKLPFSPASRTFAAYLGEVVAAYRRAARLRDEFVRANLRLVVTMARRYDRGVMPLSDLIQEGNLGLMHAVSRFDYRRGLRFSTYACWWIRHAIGRALADKARAVRVPVHMIEAQQQLAKVKQKLVAKLGRQPTRAELAEASDMSLAKLNQMSRFLLGQSVSLDGPVGTGEDSRSLGEVLSDPASEEWSPVQDLTSRTLAAQVSQLMNKLSPIEADVLRQRFGLDDDEERTFREIGDQYKLSRERIRQIQNSALGKLRRGLDRGG